MAIDLHGNRNCPPSAAPGSRSGELRYAPGESHAGERSALLLLRGVHIRERGVPCICAGGDAPSLPPTWAPSPPPATGSQLSPRPSSSSRNSSCSLHALTCSSSFRLDLSAGPAWPPPPPEAAACAACASALVLQQLSSELPRRSRSSCRPVRADWCCDDATLAGGLKRHGMGMVGLGAASPTPGVAAAAAAAASSRRVGAASACGASSSLASGCCSLPSSDGAGSGEQRGNRTVHRRRRHDAVRGRVEKVTRRFPHTNRPAGKAWCTWVSAPVSPEELSCSSTTRHGQNRESMHQKEPRSRRPLSRRGRPPTCPPARLQTHR
jgi:hypothetical protein